MTRINFYSISLLVILGFIPYIRHLSKFKTQPTQGTFKLSFVTVGFGMGMYQRQPVFKINGTKLIFSSEDVWEKSQQKIIKDTLLITDFRQSSIDSITNFISNLSDTTIRKTNIRIIGGSAKYLKITNGRNKTSFNLFNTSDSTADKIIAILYTYIPSELYKKFGPE